MVTMRDILVYLSVSFLGDWGKIREALVNKIKVSDEEVMKVVGGVKNSYITLIDDDYPPCLKNVYRPPFVLYFKGNREVLNTKYKLGCIGSRDCSDYGVTSAGKVLKEALAGEKDLAVVSGMAKGIDSECERMAMTEKRRIISVLGCGLNVCYPSDSKDVYEYSSGENGLLISEYPNDVKPEKENFPMRNRIIAGLIDSLLVVEASLMSGTAITVKMALEGGKDILCIPSPITSEKNLTNELIKDGAEICLSGEDILSSLKR
jgi:DNA processing protein